MQKYEVAVLHVLLDDDSIPTHSQLGKVLNVSLKSGIKRLLMVGNIKRDKENVYHTIWL